MVLGLREGCSQAVHVPRGTGVGAAFSRVRHIRVSRARWWASEGRQVLVTRCHLSVRCWWWPSTICRLVDCEGFDRHSFSTRPPPEFCGCEMSKSLSLAFPADLCHSTLHHKPSPAQHPCSAARPRREDGHTSKHERGKGIRSEVFSVNPARPVHKHCCERP